MSNKSMGPTNSEISANHIYTTFLQDKAFRLKSVLKDIQADYDNPSYDYVLKHCKCAKDLESFLKDFSHLFIVENNKVAKYSLKLEAGQETADRFFKEELRKDNHPVPIEKLMEQTENASEDIRYFIQTFYPETDFKRYFQRRPHLFHVAEGNFICLIERESAEFFRQIVMQGEGIRFINVRGNVAQAPEHIRKYINNEYPGTEFRHFLDNNCDVFRLDSNGRVFLVR